MFKKISGILFSFFVLLTWEVNAKDSVVISSYMIEDGKVFIRTTGKHEHAYFVLSNPDRMLLVFPDVLVKYSYDKLEGFPYFSDIKTSMYGEGVNQVAMVVLGLRSPAFTHGVENIEGGMAFFVETGRTIHRFKAYEKIKASIDNNLTYKRKANEPIEVAAFMVVAGEMTLRLTGKAEFVTAQSKDGFIVDLPGVKMEDPSGKIEIKGDPYIKSVTISMVGKKSDRSARIEIALWSEGLDFEVESEERGILLSVGSSGTAPDSKPNRVVRSFGDYK